MPTDYYGSLGFEHLCIFLLRFVSSFWCIDWFLREHRRGDLRSVLDFLHNVIKLTLSLTLERVFSQQQRSLSASPTAINQIDELRNGKGKESRASKNRK